MGSVRDGLRRIVRWLRRVFSPRCWRCGGPTARRGQLCEECLYDEEV